MCACAPDEASYVSSRLIIHNDAMSFLSFSFFESLLLSDAFSLHSSHSIRRDSFIASIVSTTELTRNT